MPAASQQTSCRLEEVQWKKVDAGLAQLAFHCRAAEDKAASQQSCFTRSSADNRSASQTGSWIGIVVLEGNARGAVTTQHPLLRSLPAVDYCTPPRPATAHCHSLHAHCSPCRPSTHCRRQGGCHSPASVCHLGACSHSEEVGRFPSHDLIIFGCSIR